MSGTVTLSSNAIDSGGIQQVEYFVDGNSFAVVTTSPFSTNVDTTQVTDGNYTLLAEATDNVGNTQQSSSINVIVDNSGGSGLNEPPIAVDDPDEETMENSAILLDITANDMDVDGSLNRHVVDLDGVDGVITWKNLGLNGTSQLSKFIRFRTTDTNAVLFDVELGPAEGGLVIQNGMLQLRCLFQTNSLQKMDMVSTGLAADGEWHSAGFTYNGVELTTYFDGNVVGTRSLLGDTLHHNYVSVCGRRVLSADKFLDGELSDFVVYNTGLTSTAAQDYHHGIVPTSSLLLWGRMDETGYGSGLIDSSGNGNTGTAQGGATPIEDLVSVVITGEASNGSLFNHLNGNVTYTPDAGFTGTDTFTYKVRDNEYALSNEAEVTITVTPGVSNTAPVAVDDPMGETIGDSAVLLDLTANDMDVDGSLNRHVVNLDGVDGVITWKNLGLNGTSQVSKFIRFRTTDTNAVLFDVELGPAEGGLVIQNGMLQLRCFFQTNSLQKIDMVSTGLAANGEWHSAGFTYNGVELVAYFDGNVVGTRSLAGDTLHHNYVSVCGRRVLSADKFLDGELSDFVVYNTGLTSTAAQDYHHGIVPTSSLLLWGRMDETGYGSGLIDSSGNGNTGTAQGGATPFEDLVSVVITGEASNGSLFNHLDGNVTYTPDAGFTGTDSFTYKVRDNEYALSNEALVTITATPGVSNTAPVAVDDPMGETIGDSAVLLDLTANDMDVDGSLNRHVVDLDGVNGVITWKNLGLNGTSQLSKFIRFRTTDTNAVLFDVELGPAEGGLVIQNGMLQLRCFFQTNSLQKIDMVSTGLAANGEWHSAGFTYNGVELVAYFDGNVVGTRSLLGDKLHHNYVSVCGRRVLSSDKFLDGELSDFVVYNTGLTSTAAQDYHHGIVPTSGLLLWGRMDETGYGSGLLDSSGNGNTGTAQGGATPLEDLVSVVITGEASNGSLFNHLDGNVTYTPDAGFTGTDSFTYKVRDNEYALSNEALVTITATPGVSNTAPVAVNDPMGETIGDSAVLLDLTANDMDVDGSLNRHVVDLDGVDGVITWKNLGLNGTSQVSKFIRFRTTDTNAVLFDVELGPAEGGLVIQNGMLQLRCFFQTNSLQKIDMVSTGLAANGEWHSAGFTYNGVELVAYFDGNVVGTRSLAGDTLHHNYVSVCGRRVLSADKFLDGELSDFVVYNTGLTSTAAQDYHHGIVPTSSLLLWGRMDEIGYGSGLIDSSGNGNTGTAQGGATPLEDLVSVVITGEASNGSLFNHLDGNVTYTPDAGFTGTDTFTYKVRDNEYALSNEALVTITVTPGVSNTAPVAVDDPMGETIGDSAVLLDLTANDMDVDGSLNRHVVDLDGVNGVITWKNLGLNGTSQVSKFIRFRTTDTNAVLFDVELGPAEGGLVIQNGMLQLRCLFQTNSLQKMDMVSTGLAADGEWHSAGFTYNGVELTTYFDGNVVGTRSLLGDTLHHNYVSVCGRRVLSADKFFGWRVVRFCGV